MKKKHYSYKQLYNKAGVAIIEEYYLEASWIISAIIEDRLVSLLRQSGGILFPNGSEIKMIGPKISQLESRKSNDSLLESVLFDDILEDIKVWKDSRNNLMHALAENGSYDDSYKDMYLLATNGIILAKKLSTRARKLKKLKK